MKESILRTPRLRERLFFESEISFAYARKNPYGALAARFCAKEAAMKALGKGMRGARFREIEVIRLPSGEPTLRFFGGAMETFLELGVVSLSVSMSHSETIASAFCAFVIDEEVKPRS